MGSAGSADAGPVPSPEPLVSCAVCGTTAAAGEHAIWMREVEPGRGDAGSGRDGRSVCPSCARRYLRSIEARLPDEYW